MQRTPAAVLRAIIGVSVNEMAEFLECSPYTVHSLETGRQKMSEEMAHLLLIQTGISPDWLLAGDPKVPPVSVLGAPFTKNVYETTQATRAFFDSPPGNLLYGDLLDLWARLAAILTSASGRGEYQLAAYKATKAVQQLGKEFGQNRDIYGPTEPYHHSRQALKIVKKVHDECAADAADPVGRADEKNRQRRESAKNTSHVVDLRKPRTKRKTA